MSRPDSWMPLYIGDYLADTAHLTAMEHGAYLLLLMAYWRAGGPLDNNDAKLARIARCSVKEWVEVKPAVLAFFKVGEQLVHGRVERELARATEQHQAKAERARVAAAKRWAKQEHAASNAQACSKHAPSMPQAPPKHAPSNARGVLEECQPQSQPHSLAKASEGARTRNCWPPDAVVPDQWINLAAEQRRRAGLPAADLQVAARMFQNYYGADTANPRTMAEFQAKWNNWALKEKPDDQTRRPNRSTAGDTLRELARMAADNTDTADAEVLAG